MSLKERLAGRGRPTKKFWLLIDADGAEEIARKLADARTRFQTLLLVGDAQRIDAAQAVIAALEDAAKACYEPIVCTAMVPDDFELLVDAHPPRPDTDDELWDTTTLPKACFLECAPDDMTRKEWEEFCAASLSDIERKVLYNTAVAANARMPDPSLPKGWMPTQD